MLHLRWKLMDFGKTVLLFARLRRLAARRRSRRAVEVALYFQGLIFLIAFSCMWWTFWLYEYRGVFLASWRGIFPTWVFVRKKWTEGLEDVRVQIIRRDLRKISNTDAYMYRYKVRMLMRVWFISAEVISRLIGYFLRFIFIGTEVSGIQIWKRRDFDVMFKHLIFEE